MTPEAHLAIVRHWIQMAEAGFIGDFTEVFSTNYAGHLAGRIHLDLEALKQTELGFGVSFTGTTRVIDELWASGDRAVMRITTRAHHTGDFRGLAATGRAIVFTAIVIYRFENGKIAESWTELDLAGLLQQLTPAVAGTT